MDKSNMFRSLGSDTRFASVAQPAAGKSVLKSAALAGFGASQTAKTSNDVRFKKAMQKIVKKEVKKQVKGKSTGFDL